MCTYFVSQGPLLLPVCFFRRFHFLDLFPTFLFSNSSLDSFVLVNLLLVRVSLLPQKKLLAAHVRVEAVRIYGKARERERERE